MKSSNTQNNTNDIIFWLAIALVTATAFFLNYYYPVSGPVQAIIWIVWFILTLAFGYMTSKGKMVYDFAQEAKVELLKVVWPSRQETVQTTLIVMVMVALTGFILWGLDSLIMWAIAKITQLG